MAGRRRQPQWCDNFELKLGASCFVIWACFVGTVFCAVAYVVYKILTHFAIL